MLHSKDQIIDIICRGGVVCPRNYLGPRTRLRALAKCMHEVGHLPTVSPASFCMKRASNVKLLLWRRFHNLVVKEECGEELMRE